MLAHNATNAEVFRVQGTLPAERIEALLDLETQANALEAVSAHIDEAKGCFVAEDCLQAHLDDLRRLLKNMRGVNRAELACIIEQIELTQTELAREGEYGASELNEAQKLIGL